MKNIKGFHALRAFSVALVILSHVGIVEAATTPAWVVFFSVFNANYGVKTFFVLSGFLITTLLIKEHRNHGDINILWFMARRAFRILPLYFLIIGIAAVLIMAGLAEPSWRAMLFGTFYVYNFIPKADNVNYLSHLWSLAVEEQFYLVWPLVFSALFGRRPLLIAFCLALLVACWLLLHRDLGSLSEDFYTQRWTIPAIYPIALGSLFALSIDSLITSMRHPAALVASMLLIGMPLVMAVTPLVEIASTSGIAGLIAWIYLNQHNRAVISLEWRPLTYLGGISYGLYMWQGLLTGNGPYRTVPSFPLDPLLGAALTFPAAALSFHLFERHMSAIGKRFRR